MRLLIVFSFIFSLLLPVYGSAHPGGLDSNGGHRDLSTGKYHKHKKPGQEGPTYRDAVIQVKVVRVIDGDTFMARFPDGKVEKVRLRNIDTPERGEKGFTEATDRLKGLIEDKTLSIKVGVHMDKGHYLRGHYNRVLAEIIRVRISPE
ncbi:MAG: YHYH domain-containing protein [Thermodesulfobacteriota bacterium]